MLTVVMLAVVMLTVIMLSVIMLTVVMLTVILLSVVMLSVSAPQRVYVSWPKKDKKSQFKNRPKLQNQQILPKII
jgi:hypothetical protein